MARVSVIGNGEYVNLVLTALEAKHLYLAAAHLLSHDDAVLAKAWTGRQRAAANRAFDALTYGVGTVLNHEHDRRAVVEEEET